MRNPFAQQSVEPDPACHGCGGSGVARDPFGVSGPCGCTDDGLGVWRGLLAAGCVTAAVAVVVAVLF